MKIVFYTKRGEDANASGGSLELVGTQLRMRGPAQNCVDMLLEGVDRSDLEAVRAALRRAPELFNNVYLRAEVVSE